MTEQKEKREYPRRIQSALAVFFRKIKIDKEVTDNLLRSIPLWLGSLIVGVIAVVYAQVFASAEHLGKQIFLHTPWLLFVLTPACFVAAWLVVQVFAPFARGSGIPQIIAAIEISGTDQQKKISFLVGIRIIAAKIISSLVMVFGGGAVGREGPTIHIAGAVFRWVGRLLPAHWPKSSERVMILTGSAAGLAAAFNTPLGGIVFAIEELSKSHFGSFRTSLLTAVIIAGMTAQMLLGPYLYLGYPQVSGLILSMTSLVVLVAVITGIAGGIFSRIIIFVITVRKRMKTFRSQAFFIAGLAVILAAAAYLATPSVLGSGKETMISLLFHGNEQYDPFLSPARFIGPLLSFTSGAAGGVFAPALSAGAAIGSAFSTFFVLTPQQVNVLVLTGMVGFLTAVTRSPFTSSILVLEMTDRHSLIFFLMLAGLISYASAWLVDKHSLYERLKERYLEELRVTIAASE
jgi:H+/Cl- antiporter ClcA